MTIQLTAAQPGPGLQDHPGQEILNAQLREPPQKSGLRKGEKAGAGEGVSSLESGLWSALKVALCGDRHSLPDLFLLWISPFIFSNLGSTILVLVDQLLFFRPCSLG